ncbi:hypothetical protein [Enterocloster bolteae]
MDGGRTGKGTDYPVTGQETGGVTADRVTDGRNNSRVNKNR